MDSQIIKSKLVSNKNKIVHEKVLVVKSIHNSKDSLKKVKKFRKFDCLTVNKFDWYSVSFLLYETNFIFMLHGTNFVFMLFALLFVT